MRQHPRNAQYRRRGLKPGDVVEGLILPPYGRGIVVARKPGAWLVEFGGDRLILMRPLLRLIERAGRPLSDRVHPTM